LVLYSVFRPAMQVPAMGLGAVSLASIVALGWSTGGYNVPLARVILGDSIAVACFLVAGALTVIGRREGKG
jgi:hypothetical protein